MTYRIIRFARLVGAMHVVATERNREMLHRAVVVLRMEYHRVLAEEVFV